MRSFTRAASGDSRAGLSFIEILVSVMVIGILAAVASPIYSTSLLKYRAEVTAQRIQQDIMQTQRVARQTNSTRSIAFDFSDHSYVISGVQSLDRVSQPYRVSLSLPPYQIRFSSLATAALPATPLPSVAIAFDRFGMADQGIVVTVGEGSIQKQVHVAPTTGRVSIP